MQVGSLVEVEGRSGMLALDNEDGTWNVELDDGSERDVPAAQIVLLDRQRWKPDASARDATALLAARHARDGRQLAAVTDERTKELLREAMASGRTGHLAEVVPGLWVGDLWAAKDGGGLKERGIGAVVNCAAELPNHHEGLRYLNVPVRDLESEDIARYFDAACSFIDEELRSGSAGVLVHCQAGRSRSATIAVSYLMRHRGLSMKDALATCMERRWVTPNEGFMRQLESEERRLGELQPQSA